MLRLLFFILPLLAVAPPPPSGPPGPPSGPPPSPPGHGPPGPPGNPPSGPPGPPGNGPPVQPTGPLPAFQTSVSFGGKTFVNKGLVAFGAISGEATDSRGDTIGGIGSATAIESFRKDPGGYAGVMLAQPDRGHNTQGTTDYQARRHRISFKLKPYYGTDNKTYADAKSTLQQTYLDSVFYHERTGTPTTGLNPFDVRQGNPPLPIPSSTYDRISTDPEGLVLNKDGSSWISDEYGPYIYKYAKDGTLLESIAPPMAVLPYYQGKLNFNANDGFMPDTGRSPNQGFEGLIVSPDGSKLYALLQSSAVQDQNGDKGRYTRFYTWDITSSPKLIHAYVLELPVTNGKGKTLAQSELHYLSDDTFLVLARDGKGNGDTDDEAKNKGFVLYSTAGATDILNTEYTTGTKPVAPKNVLDKSITAMVGTDFIDMLDEVQLTRFGLCNNCGFSVNLINSKWESIAIAPVQEPGYPNDYFLFSFSDNDFISKQGSQDGVAYADPYAVEKGYSLDNQVLVWRVTLP